MITKKRFYIAVRKLDEETEWFDIRTISDNLELTKQLIEKINNENTKDWNNLYPILRLIKIRIEELT